MRRTDQGRSFCRVDEGISKNKKKQKKTRKIFAKCVSKGRQRFRLCRLALLRGTPEEKKEDEEDEAFKKGTKMRMRLRAR